jgi:hypothetical protein
MEEVKLFFNYLRRHFGRNDTLLGEMIALIAALGAKLFVVGIKKAAKKVRNSSKKQRNRTIIFIKLPSCCCGCGGRI